MSSYKATQAPHPISLKASSVGQSIARPFGLPVKQHVHLKRVLHALQRDRNTSYLASKIAACVNRQGRPDPEDRWPRFCRHPFCPTCRKDYVGKRVQSAQKLFRDRPRESFLWVTVVGSVVEHLVRPPFADDPVFWPDRLTYATDQDIGRAIAAMVADAKVKFDRAVRKLAPSLFLAQGAFEFDAVDVADSGQQKERLFEDLRKGGASVPGAGYAFVFHLHTLVVAQRAGSYLSGKVLTAALKDEFGKCRHQVLVTPMRPMGSVKQNVARLIAYPLKGFSEFPDAQVVELGRALVAIGRSKLLFRRAIGFRSPRLWR